MICEPWGSQNSGVKYDLLKQFELIHNDIDPEQILEDIKVNPEDFTDNNDVIENDHEVENDNENEELDPEYTPDPTKFECSECGEKFKKVFNLVKHFNKNHRGEDDLYLCPLCPKKSFEQVNTLYKHVRKTHIKSGLDGFYKRDIQWLHCEYCPKFFNQQRALETHIGKPKF